MADPVSQLADVVNRGFEWVRARAEYRRLSDSKRAKPDDLKKATAAALAATTRLEEAFVKLMSTARGRPAAKKMNKSASVIDWGKIAGVISKGAGVLEDVLSKKKNYVQVIDTDGQDVK